MRQEWLNIAILWVTSFLNGYTTDVLNFQKKNIWLAFTVASGIAIIDITGYGWSEEDTWLLEKVNKILQKIKLCPTFSKTKGNDKTFLKKRDNCHQDLKSIDHKKFTSLKEKSDMWK